MIFPFHTTGPERKYYFLGKIKRNFEDWSRITKRLDTYRRVIPVFAIYDKKQILEDGTELDDEYPTIFYRNGKLVLPRTKIVEGLSITGHSYFNEDFYTVEKETRNDGKTLRYITAMDSERISFEMSQLSKWDKEVLRLVKNLPNHVLDIICL